MSDIGKPFKAHGYSTGFYKLSSFVCPWSRPQVDFNGWLQTSRIAQNDAVLVLSAGGGDIRRNVSANIVRALDLTREQGRRFLGWLGATAAIRGKRLTTVVVIPTLDPALVTPHAEGPMAPVVANSPRPPWRRWRACPCRRP